MNLHVARNQFERDPMKPEPEVLTEEELMELFHAAIDEEMKGG